MYLVTAYTDLSYAATMSSKAADPNFLSQASALAFCVIAVLSPFAGLVAGVRFGTYKVICMLNSG